MAEESIARRRAALTRAAVPAISWRMKLRTLIIGAAAAAILFLLALTGFSAYEVDRHGGDRGWVEHTHAVLDQLEEARLQLKIAALARQEFLSERTEASRDAVRHAAEAVRWNAEAIQKLTSDNSAQAGRAEGLAVAAAEIRASVETPARRGSAMEGSPAIARAESLARSMQAEERRLLAERDVREQRSAAFALAALGAEVLFAGLFAGTALIFILSGLDERERLLAELERTMALIKSLAPGSPRPPP
jgi:hypothetical protein